MFRRKYRHWAGRVAGYIAPLVFFALTGCTEVRFYPLCVFGTDPRVTTDETLHHKVEAFVRAVVGNGSRMEISVNERFVAVAAFEYQQRELSGVWPRVACIGQTRYDVEYDQYKACVALIEQGLKVGGIPPLGNGSDGLDDSAVYCGRFVGSPATNATPMTGSGR